MIERALDASAAWPTVVVASPPVAAALAAAPARDGVRVVRNDEPERGMTHSLALADAAIDAHEPIAVMLGDLPDCGAAAIDMVVRAYDAQVDVVAPRAGARFGHPVVFGPVARRCIAQLPEGDALQRLRDEPTLRRRIVEIANPEPFEDIDTEAQLEAYRRRMVQESKG